MNDKIKAGLVFVALWLIFQLTFSSGQYYLGEVQTDRFISSIEKRIALDLPKLKLANPRFRTVTHESSVRDYLQQLNLELAGLDSPIRVFALQEVSVEGEVAEDDLIPRELRTTDQSIPLTLYTVAPGLLSRFTVLAPLLAMLMIFFWQQHVASRKKARAIQMDDVVVEKEARLVVDLHNKTLGNGLDTKVVPLSNKPFCFYLALVDYCLQHEAPSLNHNKDVPDEILMLANKYFYRLIELGHTKRKKPDFSTNLDKTLSEIRSALDDVFHDYTEAKDLFYPPKAQGEGSRSKMHNYALPHIFKEQVEFIGK